MTYPYELVVSAERNRDRAYEAVIKALEQAHRETGITRKQIAKKINKSPALVSTWLSGPSNWGLDTIDHLLRPIDAEMEYNIIFDRDRVKPNFHILPDYRHWAQAPATSSAPGSGSVRITVFKNP
jgi:transcriptional regulator with XRE-family HTH domain